MREAGLYFSGNEGTRNQRPAGGVTAHLDRSERNSLPPCLDQRLFDGKSPGETLEPPVATGSPGVVDLVGGEDTMKKPLAVACVELFYACYLNGVDPNLHRLMNDTCAFGGDDSRKLINCLIERIVDHKIIEGRYRRKLLRSDREPRTDLFLILRPPGTQPLSK